MKCKLEEERLFMVAEKRQLLEGKRNTQGEIIKTDNGPQLKAAEFNAKYCTANCITHERICLSWHKPMGRWGGSIDPWKSGRTNCKSMSQNTEDFIKQQQERA